VSTPATLPPDLIPLPAALDASVWRVHQFDPAKLVHLRQSRRASARPQASISDYEQLRDALNELLRDVPNHANLLTTTATTTAATVVDANVSPIRPTRGSASQVLQAHAYYCVKIYPRLLVRCGEELLALWSHYYRNEKPNTALCAFTMSSIQLPAAPPRGALGHILPLYTVARGTRASDHRLLVAPCWFEELIGMFYTRSQSSWIGPSTATLVGPRARITFDEVDLLKGLWSDDPTSEFHDPRAVLQTARLLQ
jgi:hypothetical protein